MVSENFQLNANPPEPTVESEAAAQTTNEGTAPASFWWLTNRDQWLVVIVAVFVVVLLGVKWQRLGYIDRSEIVMTQLRGIGEALAIRIVENREAVGPFSSIDDLQRVPGIGPKTVEKNIRWLRVEPSTTSGN
jgi:competence ComEA-like helix-hairpin-helix protein